MPLFLCIPQSSALLEEVLPPLRSPTKTPTTLRWSPAGLRPGPQRKLDNRRLRFKIPALLGGRAASDTQLRPNIYFARFDMPNGTNSHVTRLHRYLPFTP